MDAARHGDLPEPGAPGLDARDLEILAIERRWWRSPGSKEQAVRGSLGLSVTRYHQLLNVLIDRPEALEHDPVLVTRLRRLRQERRSASLRPGVPGCR